MSSRYRHAWRSFINCMTQLNKRDTFKPRNEILINFNRAISTSSVEIIFTQITQQCRNVVRINRFMNIPSWHIFLKDATMPRPPIRNVNSEYSCVKKYFSAYYFLIHLERLSQESWNPWKYLTSKIKTIRKIIPNPRKNVYPELIERCMTSRRLIEIGHAVCKRHSR